MENKILKFRVEISKKISLVDNDIITFNGKIRETSNVIEKIAYEGIIRQLVNERTNYVDLLNKYTNIFEIGDNKYSLPSFNSQGIVKSITIEMKEETMTKNNLPNTTQHNMFF